MIVVIDYNIGNVKSVCNAFEHIGIETVLSRQKQDIEKAEGLVLPGVAAFGYAIKALGDVQGLIKKAVSDGIPLLGICVGFQLLFEKSLEHGTHAGLGLVKGDIIPLPRDNRVPHMGWNVVKLPSDMHLFDSLGAEKHFYFSHSYYADIKDEESKTAYTDYGFDLPAAIQKDNVYGVQFHPEKSGPNGLRVLKNFVDICQKKGDRC